MGQSYCNLLYYMVFSTKERRPWLRDAATRNRVHAYLGGAIREEGGIPLCVGRTEDHVHLFAKLRQDHKVMDVLRAIKANSSGWVHQTFSDLRDFHWQDGYGAFTVSYSQSERVRQYILNQMEKHQQRSFREEFIAFLQAHGIEFNEEYLL